jgi:hypothetical protein
LLIPFSSQDFKRRWLYSGLNPAVFKPSTLIAVRRVS